MYLSREEEDILNGGMGESAQKAIELIVALGKVYDADGLVNITSAHLSGASYKTIGDGGVKYLEDVSKDAKVRVPATLNPLGMDRDRWKEMKISPEFAKKQLRIIELYGKMGVKTTCSCTPYLGDNVPRLGDHVAWAESSALSIVNSYIGARTNREGGPGALAAAIIGKTANYGLHLDENRRPTVIIDADINDTVFENSLLGQAVGKMIGTGVPYYRNISPDIDGIKTMAAAMAAAGSTAMFHIENITPEASKYSTSGLETIHIGKKELNDARSSLSTTDDIQLIAFGCPHLTVREITEMAAFLKDKKKKRNDVDIWFCTSSEVRKRCPDQVKILERFGPVLADTCMVVAPIESNYQRTGTNSAKAGNYLPTLCSQKVICNDFIKLMEMVI
ncbi:MAG: aconitase X catalytic domain-containing protein [Methanomassiliicoccaceae archaeon]|jgi:predicted aconitase|nr:aconitase X catalytic domain-containing protein [Methanomassiliicoccaceae archaeon]